MADEFFEDVIGVAPPSTVDVPAIVRRERRRSVVRRATVGVAAGAAILAVSVVAPRMINQALPVALPSASPSSAALPSVSPSLAAAFPIRADAATAARLNAALAELFNDLSPGIVVQPYTSDMVPIRCQAAIDGAQCGEIGSLLRDPRRGFFELEIGALSRPCTSPGNPSGCTTPPATNSDFNSCAAIMMSTHCRETTNSSGWHLVTSEFDGGMPGYVGYTVRIRTPMGVWILLMAENRDGAGASAISQARPPLSLDELKNLGLDLLARIRP